MTTKAIRHGRPIHIPKEYSTLAEMLIYIAQRYPDKGITYVGMGGEENFVSYPSLITEARRYLKALYQRGVKPGDFLILEINSAKEFYFAFWACMFGGIIAAPISQPTSWEPNSIGLLKLTNIWTVLDKPVILTEGQNSRKYQSLQETSEYLGLKFIATQEFTSSELAEIHPTKPEDLVFLQFSSGSTGTPKGVQLTNQNILMNNVASALRIEETSDDVVVTWLPHTHDMGLFGQHLTPMIAGANIVLMNPYTFVRSPYLFLKKITEHKGTWFASPNFGYDWMVRKVPDEKLSTLDLSSLRFTLNGAEPISIAVINQFLDKFSRCGLKRNVMYPAYGMAEATVGVCMGKPGSLMKVERISRSKMIQENLAIPADGQDVSDVIELAVEGYPVAGMSVRIVDEYGGILAQGMIGEIQIKGTSLTSGYYNLPDKNNELFVDGWLRTGDLGFMTANGDLVVTGRIKDIIFVRGRNYFAHDLEEVIYASGIVQRGKVALVGLFNTKTQQEELIAFIKYKFDVEKFFSIRQSIINRLQEAFGIEVTHVIPINAIPRTTSGKLQRFRLQKNYENGEYDNLLEEIAQYIEKTQDYERSIQLPENELEIFLHKSWATVLNIPATKISIDDSFFALGGNSIKAYQLLGTIEKHLKREVGPEILTTCKTIRQAAEYLQSTQTVASKIQVSWHTDSPLDIDKAVAITGVAMRFPMATNQHEFWDNLCSQNECITKVSARRKELSNESNWNDWIGELSDIDSFDNEFFEITPEEARFMDPQQRLILELSYEALEDAGMNPGIDEDRNIGVYTGISSNTYYQYVVDYINKNGMNNVHPNTMVRNMHNITATSVAHQYNFTGPALAIDTACSSFMSAMYYAVTAIRQRAISGAVVAGANIMVTPMVHRMARKAGIVSSTQYTLTFCDNADGSVLGEGVVVIYLEPLRTAVQDHKNIYGVVRGIAINNDGYSLGIMAPNPKGQYRVLLDAYMDANISPHEISYIEAHGTGTVIGDPIELNALSKLFSDGYAEHIHNIGIGSVKTSIGHLLSASGGAGLAKTLLCLKNKMLVPSPHVHKNTINPALQIERTPFYVVDSVKKWAVEDGKTRKAGVSSFGLGGTNTHVVLEEWNQESTTQSSRPYHLLTLSAKSDRALTRVIEQTQDFIRQHPDLDIGNLCFTRNRYRKHYNYRAACLISTVDRGLGLKNMTRGHYAKTRSAKIWLIIGDLKNANNRTEAITKIDDLAEKEFNRVNDYARQYCDATGKTLQQNELLYFSYWYSLSRRLQESGTRIVGISGLASGQILADLLKGRMNLSQAFKLYFSTGDTPKSSQQNEIRVVKADVVLTIGIPANELSMILPDDIQHKPKILNVTTEIENSVETKFLSIVEMLYVAGADFNWDYIHPNGSGRLINLPAYPFEKKSFWISNSPMQGKESK